jgi:hypothetical protein
VHGNGETLKDVLENNDRIGKPKRRPGKDREGGQRRREGKEQGKKLKKQGNEGNIRGSIEPRGTAQRYSLASMATSAFSLWEARGFWGERMPARGRQGLSSRAGAESWSTKRRWYLSGFQESENEGLMSKSNRNTVDRVGQDVTTYLIVSMPTLLQAGRSEDLRSHSVVGRG